MVEHVLKEAQTIREAETKRVREAKLKVREAKLKQQEAAKLRLEEQRRNAGPFLAPAGMTLQSLGLRGTW